MAQHTFEISGRFGEAEDADHLLYTPIGRGWTCRRSRGYRLVAEGPVEAVEAFVREVLLDPVSQELRGDGRAPWQGWQVRLDIGMKDKVLDLEREAIRACHRRLPDPGFQLHSLQIIHHHYLFGDAVEVTPFVRDLVNPAIHIYEAVHA